MKTQKKDLAQRTPEIEIEIKRNTKNVKYFYIVSVVKVRHKITVFYANLAKVSITEILLFINF